MLQFVMSIDQTSKIVIDARLWGIRHTGIGRYVKNVLENFSADFKKEIVIIVSMESKNEKSLAQYKKFIAHFHPYSFLSQVEIAFMLWRIKPRLVYIPHFTIPLFWKGKVVITVHDLIKHESIGKQTTTRHQSVYWLKYLLYLFLVKRAVVRSSKILLPVNYWK